MAVIGALAATALLGPAAAGLWPSAATAAAQPPGFPTPAEGVFTVVGHGLGHGIGMSQYGAEGAARRGLSAARILAFYYPGTTLVTEPASTIRVWLSEAYPGQLAVAAAPGLRLVIPGRGMHVDLPAGASAWRIVPGGAGEQVQSATGGRWRTLRVGRLSSFPGPLLFAGPPALTLLSRPGAPRQYVGTLTAVRAGGGLLTVDTLPLEAYVAGVVPRESPAGWLPAELAAQAVAARSYAVAERAQSGGRAYDICDTQVCQVYGGAAVVAGGSPTSLQPASSTAAVTATAGQVLTYGGAPAVTMFSASDGGYTVGAAGYPYLTAHSDPYDRLANPLHDWTARLTAAQLQAAFPQIGTLDGVSVVRRDGHGQWGGRVLAVRLVGHRADGTATSVVLSEGQFAAVHPWPRYADGIRSDFFTLVTPVLTATAGAAPAGGGAVAVFTRTRRGTARLWLLGPGRRVRGPVELGGHLVGGPSVATGPAGTLLAVRGSDGALYVRSRLGARWDRWTAWRWLGGRLASRPAVVATPGGGFLVAARGADGALWTRAIDAAGRWGRWADLGGALTTDSGPAAAVVGERVVLLARGTGGALFARAGPPDGRWSRWTSLGGHSLADIAAVAVPGGLQVVVRATDGAAWSRRLVGTHWRGWQFLGGHFHSGLTAVVTRAGTVTLFGAGADGALYRRVLTLPATGGHAAGAVADGPWGRLG